MIYECEMVTRVIVRIKADDEVQALDYIQTHDFSDIREQTSDYSIEYDDNIIDCYDDNEDYAIDISKGLPQETCGISVETLYKEYGENLTYCKIEKTEDENETYFDLYNRYGLLSICDGENAVIVKKDDEKIRLYAEDEEDINREFDLTPEEFKIATFN